MRVTKTADRGKSVYGARPPAAAAGDARPRRRGRRRPAGARCGAPAARAEQAGTVLDAREALRKRDRNRLAALRAQAAAEREPARPLGRLLGAQQPPRTTAQQPELTAFAERWSGSYVEDRLRNDWLLELGRRRDWANFAAEFPRFRMNDDREVTCYSLVTEQLAGARRARPRRSPPGWRRRRPTTAAPCSLPSWSTPSSSPAPTSGARSASRPRPASRAPRDRPRSCSARRSATSVGEVFDGPARFLGKKATTGARVDAELAALALARLAATDSESVAGHAGRRAGSRRCRPTSPPGPGPASPGRARSSCSPRRPTSSCAPSGPTRKGTGARAVRRAARLEGARRAARRRRQAALAAGDAGDRRDVAGRAEGPGLGLLEGAGAAGAGRKLAGRRGPDGDQAASC